MDTRSYGKLSDGLEIQLFTMVNKNGLRARVTNFGAILVSMETPDRDGNLTDVTLGFDALAEWVADKCYMGATAGRYANRIARGRFTLDGRTYQLATNDGANHLHGGVKGFDKVVWTARPVEGKGTRGVALRYVSADGEEGYPGELTTTVTYTLTDADELAVEYEAACQAATVVNLTHHSYWNLRGPAAGDVLGHELTLLADRYTPVDATLIPTGELAAVAGGPMDFTKATTIGAKLSQVPGGYDHNWVLRNQDGTLAPAAAVHEPASGRVMEISTTEPGIQFYAGNFLDGGLRGKGGAVYRKHYGFCLETQHYPDSPNQPAFPTTVLRPGQVYRHKTVHTFSAR